MTLFNGTKQNGNPTVLFHTFTANVPIVLVSEMRDSPLPGYGKVFHTPVSTAVGGGVPPGIVITNTDFTLSKSFKDKKILKKAKKAKKNGNTKQLSKLKKKAKKSWVTSGVHGRHARDAGGLHPRPARADAVPDRHAAVRELAR